MVGHGLITPDELVTIHKVGLEMDEVRPDLAVAHRVAERAVTQDREERARIKEQKKAEAAERKKRHAEEVAHRRATDIVYLGRGVSRAWPTGGRMLKGFNRTGCPSSRRRPTWPRP